MTRFLVCLFSCLIAFTAVETRAAFDCSVLLGDTNFLETKYGTIQLTDPAAIQYHDDILELQRILHLPVAERKEALIQFTAQKDKTRIQQAAVFINYAIAMYLGAHIIETMPSDPGYIASTVPVVASAAVFADMISAFFHKFLDSVASERNPFWGTAARAFRLHHEYQGNLSNLSYMQNVSAFGKLMLPFYAVQMIAAPHMSADVNLSILTMLLLFSNGTEIHRQAHLPSSKVNPAVKELQNWNVLLNPRSHAEHHKTPLDTAYGIINGMSNYLTRPLWKPMDRILWKYRNKMPHNWVHHPESIPPDILNDMLQELRGLKPATRNIPQALIVSIAKNAGGKAQTAQLDELLQLWVLDQNQTLWNSQTEDIELDRGANGE